MTVTGGAVTGNNLVWKKLSFTAVTTAKIRVTVNAAADSVARIAEVEAWGTAAATAATNVAASANGGAATAQNYTADGTYAGLHFQPSYANDGTRYIHGPGGDQFWRDEHGLASWLQVDFNGTKTINEIDVYTIDGSVTQADPTATQTFSSQGATAYDVQYWNGSAWTTVTGGAVTGNNLVWKKFTFSNITTSKIRVVVNASADSVARIAEVEAWTIPISAATANINWLVTDQLGTPRMVFDQSGSLATTKRHDYAPFGEELLNGARATTVGYASGDQIRQKFTQKERDNETGLDYFEARYYANTQGRFSSADPITVTYARMNDPQGLNLYSYTRNNPLVFVDDDGKQTKKAKVIIDPPVVSRTTYDVSGATAKEAADNSTKHDGFQGATTVHSSVRYTYGGIGKRLKGGGSLVTLRLQKVEVTTTITIDIPKWADEAKATESEQKAWDAGQAGLNKHEDGHKDIDIAAAQDIGDSAAETPPATARGKTPAEAEAKAKGALIADADSRVKAASDRRNKKNEDYDKETDHGRKQTP